MRRRRRRPSTMNTIDQINVTPLLDLTFLLLIAFMITMPLMEYGTSVNPPEMNAQVLPPENFKSVTLTKDGSLDYEKRTVSREELMTYLRDLKNTAPKTILLVRADGSRSYNDVVALMKDIKNSGFTNISLVTQAEGKATPTK